MRFRLRTLLVLFLLLCTSAPWWPDMYHSMKIWVSPPARSIQRAPTNDMTKVELDQLVKQVRLGMTVEQINRIFGFKPSQHYSTEPGVIRANWAFNVRDWSAMIYAGEFESGRLKKGDWYAPV